MRLFTNYGLKHACIKYNWFTGGSNEQYSKLFEMNNDGASLHELALIIWLCTPNADVQVIELILFKEFREELKARLDSAEMRRYMEDNGGWPFEEGEI